MRVNVGDVHIPSGSQDRNLDLLRAIAVLLVLLTHTLNYTVAPVSFQPTLELLGNVGVAIFFVHTSLVLMRSLERSEWRGLNGWERARDFYVRRAFRIYPLAVITVVAVIAFHIQREPTDPRYIPGTRAEIAANLTLTQNLWGLRSILAPLWSLPYEVEMYVLLPLLFVLVTRLKSSWQLLVVGGTSVVVAVGYAMLTSEMRGVWRLSVINYLPCFIAGILAYRASRLLRPRLPPGAWPIAILGATTAISFTHPGMDLGYWRAWMVSLAIAFFIPLVRELPRSGLTAASHTIAKYSYGIYLSHVPVLDLVVRTMRGDPIWFRTSFGAACLVVIPLILYHFLEAPLIRLGAAMASSLASRPASEATIASTAPAP